MHEVKVNSDPARVEKFRLISFGVAELRTACGRPTAHKAVRFTSEPEGMPMSVSRIGTLRARVKARFVAGRLSGSRKLSSSLPRRDDSLEPLGPKVGYA